MKLRSLGLLLAAAAAVHAACSPDYSFNEPAPDGGQSADAAPPPDAETGADSGADADAEPEGVSLRDCVLLLHMDETDWSGVGAVRDSSGQNNHGLAEGTAKSVADGKFGRAGSFDGNAWITIRDATSLHPNRALTLAAWINPLAFAQVSTDSFGIFAKRKDFTAEVAFTLFLLNDAHAYVDIQTTRFFSKLTFQDDRWYHLAVVYDGANVDAGQRVRLYINGALDESHTADPQIGINTQDLVVGALPGGGGPFRGRIDEAAIWTRALSDEEVARLAKATTPLH